MRIALVWVATFAALALVFFFFAEPNEAAINSNFGAWSIDRFLSIGIMLGAMTLTGSIYSKK